MDIKELKELYNKEFGQYPHHKTAEATIIAKLKAAGIDVGVEPKSTEPITEPIKEPLKEVSVSTLKEASVVDGSEFPIYEGRGATALHRVYFNGKEKQWTANSIRSMRSMAEHITFPEGTQYQEAATFNKCKNC